MSSEAYCDSHIHTTARRGRGEYHQKGRMVNYSPLRRWRRTEAEAGIRCYSAFSRSLGWFLLLIGLLLPSSSSGNHGPRLLFLEYSSRAPTNSGAQRDSVSLPLSITQAQHANVARATHLPHPLPRFYGFPRSPTRCHIRQHSIGRSRRSLFSTYRALLITPFTSIHHRQAPIVVF